jgi:hypothetical protein
MRDHSAALPYPGADLSTPTDAAVQPAGGDGATPESWTPALAGEQGRGDEPQLPLGAPDNSHRPLP